MDKLYAIKLKTTRSAFNGRVVDAGHHTTLSFNQVINLILKKGIGSVEIIRHDDKTPRNAHQLNRTQLLELWQAVDRKKKSN